MSELFQNDAIGAVLSTCRRYRYRLWRVWDGTKPMLCFIGLNPSTADEREDDQTITVLTERAKREGFGGIQVVNLFALRSREPAAIHEHRHAVEEAFSDGHNDAVIEATARDCAAVLCGWGTQGGLRGREVLARLRKIGIEPLALVVNSDGSPRHPLYVGYDKKPQPIPA